jgi:hypothetical protein
MLLPDEAVTITEAMLAPVRAELDALRAALRKTETDLHELEQAVAVVERLMQGLAAAA